MIKPINKNRKPCNSCQETRSHLHKCVACGGGFCGSCSIKTTDGLHDVRVCLSRHCRAQLVQIRRENRQWIGEVAA